MSEQMDIQSMTLEKLRVALSVPISKELVDSDIAFRDDWLMNQIVMEIHGAVWAEQLESETIQWPADWWEAFKDRWFPAWAKKRWPVCYASKRFNVKAVYPDLRPSIPSSREQAVIKVLRDYDKEGDK